ncbi:MAG: Rieske 2Fe-2S domain-containing protein [Polyangia bacterium]
MSITRRTFVKGGLAVPVLPVVVGLGGSGCGNDVSAAPIVETTVDDDSTSLRYGQIEVAVPLYPQLAAAGGAVTLRIAALASGTRPFTVPDKGVLLFHRNAIDGSAEYVATRADCPHQGCPLGYSAKDDRVECPCHGSRFLAVGDASDPTSCAGLVVHLPAKSNLTVYGVEVDGDRVWVNLQQNDSCGAVSFPPVVGGTITVPIAKYPALAKTGGTLIGTPDGLGDTIIIARTDDTTVVTLSDICTHKRCAVALDASHMQLACPCHGSTFAYDGSVTAGPATLPLRSYATKIVGENIVVTIA